MELFYGCITVCWLVSSKSAFWLFFDLVPLEPWYVFCVSTPFTIGSSNMGMIWVFPEVGGQKIIWNWLLCGNVGKPPTYIGSLMVLILGIGVPSKFRLGSHWELGGYAFGVSTQIGKTTRDKFGFNNPKIPRNSFLHGIVSCCQWEYLTYLSHSPLFCLVLRGNWNSPDSWQLHFCQSKCGETWYKHGAAPKIQHCSGKSIFITSPSCTNDVPGENMWKSRFSSAMLDCGRVQSSCHGMRWSCAVFWQTIWVLLG